MFVQMTDFVRLGDEILSLNTKTSLVLVIPTQLLASSESGLMHHGDSRTEQKKKLN